MKANYYPGEREYQREEDQKRIRILESQLAITQYEYGRLRERLETATIFLKNSLMEDRIRLIDAPEDPEIKILCERIGYGAVMDSVGRQWAKKNPGGAFALGPCRESIQSFLNPTDTGKQFSHNEFICKSCGDKTGQCLCNEAIVVRPVYV
jgi:hypothetical protein